MFYSSEKIHILKKKFAVQHSLATHGVQMGDERLHLRMIIFLVFVVFIIVVFDGCSCCSIWGQPFNPQKSIFRLCCHLISPQSQFSSAFVTSDIRMFQKWFKSRFVFLDTQVSEKIFLAFKKEEKGGVIS